MVVFPFSFGACPTQNGPSPKKGSLFFPRVTEQLRRLRGLGSKATGTWAGNGRSKDGHRLKWPFFHRHPAFFVFFLLGGLSLINGQPQKGDPFAFALPGSPDNRAIEHVSFLPKRSHWSRPCVFPMQQSWQAWLHPAKMSPIDGARKRWCAKPRERQAQCDLTECRSGLETKHGISGAWKVRLGWQTVCSCSHCVGRGSIHSPGQEVSSGRVVVMSGFSRQAFGLCSFSGDPGYQC